MKHYVYKITDPNTEQYYFGSRSHQYPENDEYMGSMKTWTPEDKSRLVKEIIKDNFETREDAIEFESVIIQKHIDDELNENYHIPSKGFHTFGIKISETHKRRISESRIKNKVAVGEKNPMYGRTGSLNPLYGTTLDIETKRKMKDGLCKYIKKNGHPWKNRVHNDSTKNIMSNKRKQWWDNVSDDVLNSRNEKLRKKATGRVMSDETKKKMSLSTIKWHEKNEHPKPMLGKFHKEETKQKIGNAHRGKIVSDDTKKKLRDANIEMVVAKDINGYFIRVSKDEFENRDDLVGTTGGVKQPKLQKKVICITDNKEFDSLKEAANYYSLNNSNLSKYIKKNKPLGMKKHGRKLYFDYI